MWKSSVGVASDLMAWTPARGVYPFVAFGNDTSKEASGFGTDGKFMAWTQSEGRNYADDTFAERDVMVAPYEEDPAKLAPVRLRSWPSQYSLVTPWTVGCGYAAHSIVPGRTLIVRIADGVSWETPTPGCTAPNFTDDWCFEDAYAITCDEVFLRGGYINLARIKLDALGPGTPPD